MLGHYQGGSPMAKRPRMGDEGINGSDHLGGMRPGMLPMGGGGGSMGERGDYGQSSAMVSRVLQIRGLSENTMEADLVDALSHFGPVSYVSLSGRGVGLVEFEDISAAERCVTHNRSTDIMVLNSPAYFTYASIQLIPRQGLESERPSNVLIFYVQNPKYPITPDVIHAIVKPVARVNRIIVNRQSGVQALVEMADIDSARIAKQRLNGCDIYSGCCTLKIEYAKMQRLNVMPANADHADYVPAGHPAGNENPLGFDELGRPIYGGDSTASVASGGGHGMDVKPGLGGGAPPFGSNMPSSRGGIGLMDDYQSAAQAQIAALNASGGSGAGGGGGGPGSQQPAFVGAAQPPFGAPLGSQMMLGPGGGAGLSNFANQQGRSYDQGPPPMRHPEPDHYQHQHPPGHRMVERGPSGPNGCGLGGDNAVLMIYGVDPEKVNCDKLFNLFCLYGNVMRVKFLKSKNDTVMVQMGDSFAAQRAMDCLRDAVVFGKPLHMAISRQPQLKEVHGEPLELPDKTTSYKDFSNVRLNRFVTPEIASKNRINPPQRFLYFFNAPPNIPEDRLYKVFADHHAPKPTEVKLFPQRAIARAARNSAGLIEFEDETQAVEGIMLCNHAPMGYEGSNHPFVLKLCFAGPANTSVGVVHPQDSGDRGHGGHIGSGGSGGYRGGGGGGRDRDRERGPYRRDREDFSREGDGDGRTAYNGPGGPRQDRDRRDDGFRDFRDRPRDRGGDGDYSYGRGRGRGGGGGR